MNTNRSQVLSLRQESVTFLFSFWVPHIKPSLGADMATNWSHGYSPRCSSYSRVETLSYLAAALPMGQALVNKANRVHALMKLSLVEKTGIEHCAKYAQGNVQHSQSGEHAKASLTTQHRN